MILYNKKYKAILLIFLSVVLRSFAQSAETITLTIDEAVAYAHAHSRTLKSADIDLEIAKRASDNAWNVFLPDVRATGTLNRTTDISSSIEQANALGAIGKILCCDFSVGRPFQKRKVCTGRLSGT